MKNIKNILVFGPQGSGKDTQSEMLSRYLNIPSVVMGDLIRKEIKEMTEVGQKVSELYKEGKLAPDEIALSLLKKMITSEDTENGCILNGFPRNLKQAKALEKITHIDLVVELYISDEEGIQRLSGRRVCPDCGTTFHLKFKPSKKEGICDRCGEKLIIREDDKPEAIKKRLAIYHQETEPLREYYKEKGIYLKINGEQSIPDVFEEIKNKLKSLK